MRWPKNHNLYFFYYRRRHYPESVSINAPKNYNVAVLHKHFLRSHFRVLDSAYNRFVSLKMKGVNWLSVSLEGCFPLRKMSRLDLNSASTFRFYVVTGINLWKRTVVLPE